LSDGPLEAQKRLTTVFDGYLSVCKEAPSICHLIHAILSSSLFSFRISPQERVALAVSCRVESVTRNMFFVYPRLFCVEEMSFLPLCESSFAKGNVFLFQFWDRLAVFVNKYVDSGVLMELFGVDSFENLPSEVPRLESEVNLTVNGLIEDCWRVNGGWCPVDVIPQGDPREVIFVDVLVDDSKVCGFGLEEWIRRNVR
jgi:hypothetical protein